MAILQHSTNKDVYYISEICMKRGDWESGKRHYDEVLKAIHENSTKSTSPKSS